MEKQELTLLTLIHDEVKGVREEIREFRDTLSATQVEVGILKDRSNRAKIWGAGGVIGSMIAGAIGWFRT